MKALGGFVCLLLAGFIAVPGFVGSALTGDAIGALSCGLAIVIGVGLAIASRSIDSI